MWSRGRFSTEIAALVRSARALALLRFAGGDETCFLRRRRKEDVATVTPSLAQRADSHNTGGSLNSQLASCHACCTACAASAGVIVFAAMSAETSLTTAPTAARASDRRRSDGTSSVREFSANGAGSDRRSHPACRARLGCRSRDRPHRAETRHPRRTQEIRRLLRRALGDQPAVQAARGYPLDRLCPPMWERRTSRAFPAAALFCPPQLARMLLSTKLP